MILSVLYMCDICGTIAYFWGVFSSGGVRSLRVFLKWHVACKYLSIAWMHFEWLSKVVRSWVCTFALYISSCHSQAHCIEKKM